MYITPDKYSYEETREAFKEAIKGKESIFSDTFDIIRFENDRLIRITEGDYGY